MIDDDLLVSLGDRLRPVDRRLSEIELRAGTIRRRRGLTAAGSTLAIGLVIAGAALTPSLLRADRDSDPAVTSPPSLDVKAVPHAKNCTTKGDPVSDQKGTPVRYLPAASSGWTMSDGPARIVQWRSKCVDPAQLVTWTTSGADPSSSRPPQFTVMGPLKRNTAPENDTLEPPYGSKSESILVSGAPGELWFMNYRQGDLGFVFWQAADGSYWHARTVNMTSDAIVAAVNAVTIQHGTLDDSKAPPGLTTLIPRPPAVPADEANIELATIVTRGRQSLDLSIRRGAFEPSPFRASENSQLVDVNGRPGLITTSPPGRAGAPARMYISWLLPDGVTASYAGFDITGADLLALARATVAVPPGDPRLS